MKLLLELQSSHYLREENNLLYVTTDIYFANKDEPVSFDVKFAELVFNLHKNHSRSEIKLIIENMQYTLAKELMRCGITQE